MPALIHLLVLFGGSGPILLSRFDVFQKPDVVLTDKGLAFLNTLDRKLILLSLDGALVKSCGQKGQGPGEFENITTLSFNPADKTIWVYDHPKRFSIWTSAGEFKRNLLFPDACYYPKFNMDGQMFFLDHPHGGGARPKLYRYDPMHQTRSLVWTSPYDTSSNKIEKEGWALNLHFSWDPQVRFDVFGSRLISCYSSHNKVFFIDQGEVRQEVTVDLPTAPFHKEQMEPEVDLQPEIFRDLILKFQPTPEFWPAIGTILHDQDKLVWVFGFATEHRTPFIVLDQQGEQVGKGDVKGIAFAVKGRTVFTLLQSEDDFEIVQNEVRF